MILWTRLLLTVYNALFKSAKYEGTPKSLWGMEFRFYFDAEML